MSKFKNMKLRYKIGAGVATTAAVVGLGGAAFAYFTSTGSGTGNATVGTSHAITTLTITNVTIPGPGASGIKIPYSFTNTAGNGAQNFGVVSGTVTAVHPLASQTCLNTATGANAADLSIANSASPIGTVNDGAVYNSTTVTNTPSEPVISMGDTGANQDGCQGATADITLNFAQGS
jgi:hypothetical protein